MAASTASSAVEVRSHEDVVERWTTRVADVSATLPSLDAEFAVLQAARAKNAELQARLRQTQPLLWLDNAVVMTRPRTESKRLAVRPSNRRLLRGDRAHIDNASDALDVGDCDWDPVEPTAPAPRRVQWEVAKRIARVDRELRQRPPAQRYWNVRDRARALKDADPHVAREEQSSKMRLESPQRERSFVQSKEMVARPENNSSIAKSNTKKKKESEKRRKTSVPAAQLQSIDVFDDPSCRRSSPSRITSNPRDRNAESIDEENKENVPALLGCSNDEITGSDTDAAPAPAPPFIPAQVTTPPAPASADSEAANTKSRDESALNRLPSSTGRHPAPETQEPVPVSPPPPPAAPTSSLGRQVLSEFRSMPSAASFGAPPVLTTTGPMGVVKRLNGDMLRRLFSDLDTDGDGLLNRIEVSVALHRLQLSVPAPTIVSFLRRLNSTQNVAPLREAINFKQFVAFATAAFDQQQQQQQQQQEEERRRQRLGRAQPRVSTHERSPPPVSSVKPSTESASTTATRPRPIQTTSERSGHLGRALPSDESVRIVETTDATELPVEERLLRELPDLLVSRVFIAEAQAPLQDGGGVTDAQAADTVVRKSLESVVGTAVLDPNLVRDIAQDVTRQLVRELMKEKQSDDVADGDVTGLMRAAASLRESMELAGQSLATLESGVDELGTDWWKVLTEEQVAAIVQEIWRQRRPEKPSVDAAPDNDSVSDSGSEAASNPLRPPTDDEAPIAAIEEAKPVDPDIRGSEGNAVSDDPSKSTAVEIHEAVDKEAEPSRNQSTPHRRVLLVAEKSIQTGASLDLGACTRDAVAVMPASVTQDVVGEVELGRAATPRVNQRRTTLGLAILGDPIDVQNGEELPPPAPPLSPPPLRPAITSSLDILLRLRQQRRRQSNNATSNRSSSDVDRQHSFSASRKPSVSSLGSSSAASLTSRATDRRSRVESDRTAVVPQSLHVVREMMRGTGEPPNGRHDVIARSFASVRSRMSSSLSSSSVVSSRSSDAIRSRAGFFSLSGWTPSRNRRRASHRRSWMHGGDDDEEDNPPEDEDLSDGELPPKRWGTRAREDEDLSDGEIFGKTRRKLVRQMNAATAQEEQTAEVEDGLANTLTTSVESGELQSVPQLNRRYHEHLLRSTVSSLESGEAEDGEIDR